MDKNSDINQGYCITCGKYLGILNINIPYCIQCGGMCSHLNRSSSSDDSAYYCHICGENCYVSGENPICSECQVKLKK
jgi:hypothetical protein